ncbi:MAG: BlaI/MecI/CopY family transcriptional regulator [Ruminococcaceae bacterium]|nr:BlaI/MecI/CopY family transcriptional regulator [Oscillospiraceae bacterium]
MDREEMLPTEREWLIMDAVWDSGDQPTSAEILNRIDEAAKLDARTERVLLHHLCRKGLLGYVVDERDSRVYHYYPLRTREECLREKSRDFIDTYFRGSSSVAVAALLKSAKFTDEQLNELEEILKARKEGEQP